MHPQSYEDRKKPSEPTTPVPLTKDERDVMNLPDDVVGAAYSTKPSNEELMAEIRKKYESQPSDTPSTS